MDSDKDSTVHPRWAALLQWLSGHGMDVSPEKLLVIARSTPDAGYGLFTTKSIEPSAPLFTIPATALMNHLTLAPHYPPTKPELSCTQFISLHLLLHRPLDDHESSDSLFGPYISVLPRNFDFHPLTWLWKECRASSQSTFSSQLLRNLPPSILDKLEKILGLFARDWKRICQYLKDHPSLLENHRPNASVNKYEIDYLWAWLNVNTRCIYHRLAKTRSNENNMTLCPILDFANHTTQPPYTMPQATRAEIWDTGPSSRRKHGEDFGLLAPSTSSTPGGKEIFLRYGAHSNTTLFAEYGFVNQPNSEQSHHPAECELEVSKEIEALFAGRGTVGSWMREVLVDAGYWGDWTLHSSPASAYPSYRLMSALRLFHLLPAPEEHKPSDPDSFLLIWRDTLLGKRVVISQENERLWRKTLLDMCRELIKRGAQGLEAISKIQEQDPPAWAISARASVETLWREEVHVATAVMKSLEENAEF